MPGARRCRLVELTPTSRMEKAEVSATIVGSVVTSSSLRYSASRVALPAMNCAVTVAEASVAAATAELSCDLEGVATRYCIRNLAPALGRSRKALYETRWVDCSTRLVQRLGCGRCRVGLPVRMIRVLQSDAGWSSPVARWAHNPKVAGSNPAPATKLYLDQRSPVSGDLLLSLARISIPARSPFSVIFSLSPSGSSTMAILDERSNGPARRPCPNTLKRLESLAASA